MEIPFLDLHSQYVELKHDIDAAVARVLNSGWFILGRESEAFELAFKEYLVGDGEGHVIGVNSGTDALKLSLLAAGIKPGDEVITVANTAIPTATAICSLGAVPVFCDVDPSTWLMDAGLIPALITPKTRAIIPVHLYGAPCDMTRLMAVAGRFGLALVEDTAQATGALCNGRQCGTIGDFGAFSFYPSKNLGACGDGGAVFVRSAQAADRLRQLRNYGQISRYRADLKHGENSRLDEMQAAILLAKLPNLERWNQLRRQAASAYRSCLAQGAGRLRLQHYYQGAEPAHHLFVAAAPAGERNQVMDDLAARGIQTLIHYPHPLYEQPAFAPYKRMPNPVAEQLCASVFSLPLHQYLTAGQIEYIGAALAG